VGVHTSELQANVINTMYAAVTPSTYANVSLIDDSILRHLHLSGTYFADEPLLLPSLFVLHLNGSLLDAANLTSSPFNGATTKQPGMITLNQTSYSAVVGGVINATVHNKTQMHAISLIFSDHSSVQHVRAVGQWDWGAAITIYGGTKNEVSYSETGGDVGRTTLGRGIWALATSHAYVHHNHVHHAAKHALDFDAYTSSSVCWSNLCEDNLQEGIFVEENSHDNVIVDNTCRRNKNGIGVYTLDVGPVKNNMFFGNTLEDNSMNGITAGGYGHNVTKHSEANVFFSNVANGNNKGSGESDGSTAQFNPMHGANTGDYWFGNVVGTDEKKFNPIP